jgi:plastocyanin
MKNGLILLGITSILMIVCGCTQTPPAVQPTTIPTFVPTTEQMTTTTTPLFQTTTGAVSDNTIRIQNFAFYPANITVKAGSTVRWVNGDAVPHRIQLSDPHFSPILLGASQSGSQKFVEAGRYDYICLIHPYMQGTIIVE